MKRTAILVMMSLGAVSLTACSEEEVTGAVSGESDLTKKMEILADIPIADSPDRSWNRPEEASSLVRAYRFHATPDDIVDITMESTGDLSVLDSNGGVLAKGNPSQDGSEMHIRKQKFAREGDYLIAFRTAEAKKDDRPTILLSRNYSEAPISKFDCATDEGFVGGKKESFSFDIAYMKDASRRSVLNVPPEKDPNEFELVVASPDPNGHAMLLNANISVRFDNGTFSIHGDGDGIEFVDLVLYENSGYRHGYLRASLETEAYSTVTCAIKESLGRPDLK